MASFEWPGQGSSSGSNASVGLTGQAVPLDATLIGGSNPSQLLTALKTDVSGNLLVSLAAQPLTTLSTSDLADGPVTPGAVASKSMLIGGQFNTVLPTLTAAQQSAFQLDSSGRLIIRPLTSSDVVSAAQSGTWNITNISGTVSLPTGASTSANQTSGGQKSQVVNSAGTSVDAKTLATQVVSTDVGLVTNTVIHGLSTGGAVYVDVKVTPSGALSVALGDISGVVGQNTMANSLPVAIASNQSSIPVSATQGTSPWVENLTQIAGASVQTGHGTAAGTLRVELPTDGTGVVGLNAGTNTIGAVISAGSAGFSNAPVRNDYSSVNVTTAAFVQLVASTTSATNVVEIFDSSGQTMAFATGAAASEVIQFYIFPGGNGRVPYQIAAGTRISIKAISASATSGEIDINFYK